MYKNKARIGEIGGRTTKKKKGNTFFRRIGQKGGETTRDTHDTSFYSSIGRLGGKSTQKRRKKEDKL